jgi:hypothetical protein
MFGNSLLKEREMKQLQYIITTFSLIVALTGLSPVLAADAERTSGRSPLQPDHQMSDNAVRYRLAPAQMDRIKGGFLFIPRLPYEWELPFVSCNSGYCGTYDPGTRTDEAR